MKLDRLAQQVKIHHPLGIGSENELPCIAALSYVVRDVNSYDTS